MQLDQAHATIATLTEKLTAVEGTLDKLQRHEHARRRVGLSAAEGPSLTRVRAASERCGIILPRRRGMTVDQPAPLPAVYAVFVDEMNQASAARIVQGATGAVSQGAKRLHLLFQSWGGYVGDAVLLYNFFRALDASGVELTLYNGGHIASAGVTAYLGAKRRVASPRSMFMMHRSGVTNTGASGPTLENQAKMAQMEDARSISIWREHLNMPPERWDHVMQRELYFTGEDAVKYGLATETGEFAPPLGSQIYRV